MNNFSPPCLATVVTRNKNLLSLVGALAQTCPQAFPLTLSSSSDTLGLYLHTEPLKNWFGAVRFEWETLLYCEIVLIWDRRDGGGIGETM